MNYVPSLAPLRRPVRELPVSIENTPQPEVGKKTVAEAATEEAVALNEQRRVWNSGDLLGQEAEALILHRGQTYRLRCTRQGKLILYK